ncbi:MAG: ligase-associated DNA damage response DEXH box helicase [Paracoccaceae bacterium]|nr:ligase-associated DNA damage response DEXH box helicase [Paracoccaceae bacterium]
MTALPKPFAGWFAARKWAPHPHQLALLASRAEAQLLIAPTGAGKTLAGFLPTLVDLAALPGENPKPGLHTLYVSPLKALAADIGRNLRGPVAEMGLAIRIEDRTGDTPQSQRQRQRADPPHILLTTPESLALMLSWEDAPRIFAGLSRAVVDEVHALAGTKRGDQLALCLARLGTLAPGHRLTALSATVEDPAAVADWLAPGRTAILQADPGPDPDITILRDAGDPPWAGMGGRYAAGAIMDLIRAHRTSIVFINTRAQAELFFRALWEANAEGLPIGLHHGSLSLAARKRVEAAMAEGQLRAVLATSSLDLGLDWGDVDLVVQVGAPKAVKRLVQRIGRANHRYDAPSKAVLVPANRFETLECHAALEAVRAGELDGEGLLDGGLEVLCQHLLLTACAGPFDADEEFGEVRRSGPYRELTREDFDACLDFCATGGYALRAYDQWQRLMQDKDGRWRLRDPRSATRLRMNAGTIIDSETLGVRMGRRGGPKLGEVEEAFAATLTPGDSFLIGGQVVQFDAMRELTLQVSPSPGREPKIAVFSGTKLATSTELSQRVIAILADPAKWTDLPDANREWLELQRRYSRLPRPGHLLVETFPRGDRHFLAIYAFAGRNANQTLGLLVSKRMEEAGLAPLGFVATDYAVLLWGLKPVSTPASLLDAARLQAGLGDWLAGNMVMKRTFRSVATVAGLIERQHFGKRKTGRQTTFSSDILYDTLRRHDPDHLMLRITRIEAMRGLVDFGRIEQMLARSAARIDHVAARRVTPLAAPMLLETGKVPIKGGGAEDTILADEASLMAELRSDA